MSLSQALNQFAQNLGRYRPDGEAERRGASATVGARRPGPPVRRADSSPPEGSQKPLGPRRDTPAGAQCVLGGNPLNTR